MYLALSAATFPPDASPDELIRTAVAAGFGGIELTIGSSGPLTRDTTESRCRAIGAQVRSAGLRVAGLALTLDWNLIGSPDVGERRMAVELVRAALERDAWVGAGMLLLIAGGDKSYAIRRASSEDAWSRSREVLLELRFDAEACGTVIAWPCGSAFPPTSPGEVREFVDELTTPWAAACVNIDEIASAGGEILDWIRALGPRICALRTGNQGAFEAGRIQMVDWPTVMTALRQIRFTGPVTLTGGGDPAAARRRLELVAGASGPARP